MLGFRGQQCLHCLSTTLHVHLSKQDGGTPLFKACHKGHIDVAAELIVHGASLDLLKVCYFLQLFKLLIYDCKKII